MKKWTYLQTVPRSSANDHLVLVLKTLSLQDSLSLEDSLLAITNYLFDPQRFRTLL